MTQPDRRSGRGRKLAPPPVAACAQSHDIPVLQPEKVGATESLAALDEVGADLGVVVAFGQFLTRRVRELPRCGYLINAHASLLPRHRGAAPIQYAILSGDAESGVSIMRVEKEMDAGPVALVRKTAIRDDDDAASLSERLADLAAEGVAAAVDAIAGGDIQWTEQDERAATLAPKLRPADAALRFEHSAREMVLQVRAMAPRPGAFAEWDGERLRILRAAEVAPGRFAPAPGGTVHLADGSVFVAAGDGWVELTRVQRAGGVAQDIEAFQRGRGLRDGERLASPERVG